jgi:protein-disulfide isomerase/uncharacterized membrane protein
MLLLNKKKDVEPLSFPFYFFIVAVVCLAGLFSSIYLAISHYRVYSDIVYESFCAISRSLNCDTVSQSPYSILLGVPVSVWGIVGYSLFFFLLLFSLFSKNQRERVWTLLFIIALFFSGYSVILALISTYKIHSYCIVCIFTYAVNLLLTYFAWMIRNRYRCEAIPAALQFDIRFLLKWPKIIVPIIGVYAIGSVSMLLLFPHYWEMTPPDRSINLATGQTSDGHPWIGAENPELTIVEFSDYQCFQCKKMHYYLRRIIKKNPEKIRLVHRHFPMDHIINPIVTQPFHNGSAKMAMLSIFANQNNKFWEMNDALFDIPRYTQKLKLRTLSEVTELSFKELTLVFRNGDLWERLRKDIQAGLKYGLTGTPGFVINDNVYLGKIPANLLARYVMN